MNEIIYSFSPYLSTVRFSTSLWRTDSLCCYLLTFLFFIFIFYLTFIHLSTCSLLLNVIAMLGICSNFSLAFQITIISNWILKWTIVRLKLNGSLNCVVCTQNTWWSEQIIIFYQQDFLANSELRHYQSRFRLTYLKIVSIFIRHQNIFDSGTELQRGLKLIEKRWTSFLCYGVKLLVLNTLNLNHKEFRFERTPHPVRGSLNVQ